ncbi:hypothetical protein BJ138DRAFT_1106649 [Hygrophoropsis aurantiaca]|uniref:Uncharacterized protein n=1 Tax=Hygrophoropsis aurantiaca TaxID=72124 RepID=A0ACB7ZV93_9AGAM|nr:hypothetical protein BJ138DRAFT_1106649 [Hygrophoropsis aurantiaca]
MARNKQIKKPAKPPGPPKHPARNLARMVAVPYKPPAATSGGSATASGSNPAPTVPPPPRFSSPLETLDDSDIEIIDSDLEILQDFREQSSNLLEKAYCEGEQSPILTDFVPGQPPSMEDIMMMAEPLLGSSKHPKPADAAAGSPPLTVVPAMPSDSAQEIRALEPPTMAEVMADLFSSSAHPGVRAEVNSAQEILPPEPPTMDEVMADLLSCSTHPGASATPTSDGGIARMCWRYSVYLPTNHPALQEASALLPPSMDEVMAEL